MKIFFLFLALLTQLALSAQAKGPTNIRIGWQVPWTVQGQLVQILKHTDILRKNGLSATFLGKTYGPELNELALAGEVDVILTADQPAAILFAKSEDWWGVGRLMYNRTSTYVPIGSPIQSVADLKGKTVGVPFGAAAERIVHKAVRENGLQEKDVRFVNLGMLEHAPLISSTGGSSGPKWGQFDALSGFDPIPALLEAKEKLKTIHTGQVCSLIVMKKSLSEKQPEVAKALVKSFADAYAYYRAHKAEANAWFLQEAQLKEADPKALALTESLEPNLKGGRVKLTFTEGDIALLQEGADFVSDKTGKNIVMKDRVTNQFTGNL